MMCAAGFNNLYWRIQTWVMKCSIEVSDVEAQNGGHYSSRNVDLCGLCSSVEIFRNLFKKGGKSAEYFSLKMLMFLIDFLWPDNLGCSLVRKITVQVLYWLKKKVSKVQWKIKHFPI